METPGATVRWFRTPPWCGRDLIAFFAWAYGIAWVLWLPLVLGKGGCGILPIQLPSYYVAVGTIGPAAASLICQRTFNGNWRACRLWSSARQVAMGILAGSLLLLLACLSTAAGSTQSGYRLWNWSALVMIPRLFLPNLLMGPLGEEPGWRGFALPRLQKGLQPWAASTWLGLLWAGWHLPLFFISFYTMPFWLYVPFLTAASVIIGFGWNVSGQSNFAALVLHGLLNVGLGVMWNDFLGTAAMRPRPISNAVLTASFLAVALVLAIATKGRLGLKEETAW